MFLGSHVWGSGKERGVKQRAVVMFSAARGVVANTVGPNYGQNLRLDSEIFNIRTKNYLKIYKHKTPREG